MDAVLLIMDVKKSIRFLVYELVSAIYTMRASVEDLHSTNVLENFPPLVKVGLSLHVGPEHRKQSHVCSNGVTPCSMLQNHTKGRTHAGVPFQGMPHVFDSVI